MITVKRVAIAIFVLIVLCGLVGLGLFSFRQRLGLALNGPMPQVILTNTPETYSSSLILTNVPPSSTPTVAPTETEISFTPAPPPTQIPEVGNNAGLSSDCGETAAWNVLVLGSDMYENYSDSLLGSDLTRVMRVDFPNNRVIVYAFPRDLWVNTAGLGLTNPTINATQLGRVYFEGRIRSPQYGLQAVMVDGLRTSAAAIQQNFSVQIDHYLALDLVQLPAIIDSVGGIPIYVPQRTTDLWRPFVIPAGYQVLNGIQTAEYASAFMGTDFGRIHRNEILLEAIRQKLLDPSVWPMIPSLYARFSSVIGTDFTPEQITHLACLLKNVGPNGIIQDSVRPEWTSPGPNGSLLWNRYYISTRLQELGIIQ